MKFLGAFGTVPALTATDTGAQQSANGEGDFVGLARIEVRQEA